MYAAFRRDIERIREAVKLVQNVTHYSQFRTTRAGDTFGRLARELYDDAEFGYLIRDANPSAVFAAPGAIALVPGQTLVIPPRDPALRGLPPHPAYADVVLSADAQAVPADEPTEPAPTFRRIDLLIGGLRGAQMLAQNIVAEMNDPQGAAYNVDFREAVEYVLAATSAVIPALERFQ